MSLTIDGDDVPKHRNCSRSALVSHGKRSNLRRIQPRNLKHALTASNIEEEEENDRRRRDILSLVTSFRKPKEKSNSKERNKLSRG